jgi:hypothetical protein
VVCFYATDTILFMWLTEHSCQHIDYLRSTAQEEIWEEITGWKILMRETEAFTENNRSCATLTTTPPKRIATMQQNNSDKFCKLCYNISLHQDLIIILHSMAHKLMPVPVSNGTFTFSLLIPTKVHKTKVLPKIFLSNLKPDSANNWHRYLLMSHILFSRLTNLYNAMLDDFRKTFNLNFMTAISAIHIITHTSLLYLNFKLWSLGTTMPCSPVADYRHFHEA